MSTVFAITTGMAFVTFVTIAFLAIRENRRRMNAIRKQHGLDPL